MRMAPGPRSSEGHLGDPDAVPALSTRCSRPTASGHGGHVGPAIRSAVPAPSRRGAQDPRRVLHPAAPGGGGAGARPPPRRPRTAHRGRFRPAATAPSSPPRRARVPARGCTGSSWTPTHAAATRRSVPGARILVGDALRGGRDAWCGLSRATARSCGSGTRPTTARHRCSATRARTGLCARVGLDEAFPRGTSLRDDYAFFLLLASERLGGRPGVLAWVTSATLLDAFLYASLRRRLLDRLALREVVDLGGGSFTGTQVRTCVTVWRTRRGPAPSPRFRAWTPRSGPQGTQSRPFSIGGPEWTLRPVPAEAGGWISSGVPPASRSTCWCRSAAPGSRPASTSCWSTRDPDRLLARVDAFLRPRDLERFARAPGASAHAPPQARGASPDPRDPVPRRPARRPAVPPLGRGAAPRRAPESARAFCYLDRRLIPRGDHRMVGTSTPTTATASWCSTCASCRSRRASSGRRGASPLHRHTRFAPLLVPERIRSEGPTGGTLGSPAGPPVPNLSARGLDWARRVGGPRERSGASRPSSTRPRSRTSGRRPSGAAGSSRFRWSTEPGPEPAA